MKCEHGNCKRTATQKNMMYFPDKYLCTYHANIATKEGRRLRKYGHRLAIVKQKDKQREEENNA